MKQKSHKKWVSFVFFCIASLMLLIKLHNEDNTYNHNLSYYIIFGLMALLFTLAPFLWNQYAKAQNLENHAIKLGYVIIGLIIATLIFSLLLWLA